MIRQDINRSEWEEYKSFWENALNPTFGDQVSVFDVHNWGGDFDCKESQFSYGFFEELHELSRKTRFVCPELIERFFILLNGDVALCCGDENATLNIGNIFSEDPYSIFNGVIFRKYRSFMQEGRLAELERCSACSVAFSKMKSLYLDVK